MLRLARGDPTMRMNGLVCKCAIQEKAGRETIRDSCKRERNENYEVQVWVLTVEMFVIF